MNYIKEFVKSFVGEHEYKYVMKCDDSDEIVNNTKVVNINFAEHKTIVAKLTHIVRTITGVYPCSVYEILKDGVQVHNLIKYCIFYIDHYYRMSFREELKLIRSIIRYNNDLHKYIALATGHFAISEDPYSMEWNTDNYEIYKMFKTELDETGLCKGIFMLASPYLMSNIILDIAVKIIFTNNTDIDVKYMASTNHEFDETIYKGYIKALSSINNRIKRQHAKIIISVCKVLTKGVNSIE